MFFTFRVKYETKNFVFFYNIVGKGLGIIVLYVSKNGGLKIFYNLGEAVLWDFQE